VTAEASTSSDAGASNPGGNAAGGEAGAGGASEPEVLTCADTVRRLGAVGCEFWPTFVANPVWTTFLPGVAITNEGLAPSDVAVDGPNGFRRELTLAPGESASVELPWVPELKGPEWSRANTSGARTPQSTRVSHGAYRVTSSLPIAVWQFNPLRVSHTGDGCPLGVASCRAGSADGTALLPSTALSGNYRVFGYSSRNGGAQWGSVPSGVAITATQDGTSLVIQAGPHCGTERVGTSELGPCTVAGSGLDAISAGGVLRLTLNAGEVVQFMGALAAQPGLHDADLSGTLIEASQRVQVVAFNAAANVPDDSVANADHMEELLPAAEFLADEYVVVPPTAPLGAAGSHVVRLFGHVDGTVLSYPVGKPPGAPDVLNAGDVVQLPTPSDSAPTPDCVNTAGKCVTSTPFIVEGTRAFGVASYMPGSVLQTPSVDPTDSRGDPAASFVTPPQQFDDDCSFFIPEGYKEAYVDVLLRAGQDLTLDGAAPASSATPIGQSEWSVLRLPVTTSGWHRLATSDGRGIGAQVSAFDYALGLYYAACARGRFLSEPPVIISP
jgi:hypothetical protein